MNGTRTSIGEWLNDFSGLLFPRRCAGCDHGLYRHEKILCTACAADLPLARYHDDPFNRVEQLFLGKVQLEAASSFLLFNRAGVAQRMLHRLKYKMDLDIGIELGRMMAQDLQGSERFKGLDLVIAVPLHASKEKQRGFNQSQVLVDGMVQIMGLPTVKGALVRSAATTSQTKRGRLARWKNVREAFTVKDPRPLEGRRILLVDDVVTTGATIEACVRVLNSIPGTRIHVYTAACA